VLQCGAKTNEERYFLEKYTVYYFATLEQLADLIVMAMLMAAIGAISFPGGTGTLAAMLIPFFLKRKKTEGQTQKAKLRRNMILLLLLPILVCIIAVAAVVVSLLLYFG
jgi:peptidoglycan biosynthesis protein MviN/MurJ (putative lipid II flippase)